MNAPSAEPAEPTGSNPVPLTEPAEGVPPVVSDPETLRQVAAALAGADGPIAVDTERASGYRYSQRAYLVQLRREGAGTVLIDPVALKCIRDRPCLAELGLRPGTLFDTELAGRLAGFERVALGTLVERLLGYRLEKGHGAADWSRRPLPADWLNYAALDVELLIPLRHVLERELRNQGKLDWALEEFEAVRLAPAPRPRQEPWRRTSGIHRVRTPRQLAAVRALWEARNAIARERDIAPGRVLPDSALMEAATVNPRTHGELLALPVFRGRAQRRLASTWLAALRLASQLPKDQLPDPAPAHEGPPPVNRWSDKDPDAAARLAKARAALGEIAQRHNLPVENLLLPDLVRRTCWQPPADTSPTGVAEVLRAGGARAWQVALTSEVLSTALRATA